MSENEANNSNNIIISYKNLAETPLSCLERVRSERGIKPDIPMTYAGRLDPMAEGLLIILSGDECKNKDKYLGLDKTYEFQILVGFSTDTNDLLGLITSPEERFPQVLGSLLQSQKSEKAQPDHSENLSSGSVEDTSQLFIGTFSQKYPSFSSKTVDGKQLFQLALDDELPTEMPEHEITIYNLKYNKIDMINKEDLRKEIIRRIHLVKGDFRQSEITKKWDEVLDIFDQNEFQIISLSCDCSSGTYIRQLVADMSDSIGIPFVTYSIKRTKVGDYINEH